jgi:hypothetical protein
MLNFRFRLRTLMIAVALVAALSAASLGVRSKVIHWRSESIFYARQAVHFASSEQSCLRSEQRLLGEADLAMRDGKLDEAKVCAHQAAAIRERAERYGRIKRAYQRAAKYPWEGLRYHEPPAIPSIP